MTSNVLPLLNEHFECNGKFLFNGKLVFKNKNNFESIPFQDHCQLICSNGGKFGVEDNSDRCVTCSCPFNGLFEGQTCDELVENIFIKFI